MQEDAELGAYEDAEPALGLGYWHGLSNDFADRFRVSIVQTEVKLMDLQLSS